MSIENITVAGGGVLGSQIAFQSAYKGKNVTIWLRSPESIERCQKKLDTLLETYLATLEKMKSDARAYCAGLTDSTNLTDEEIDALKEQARAAYDKLNLTIDLDEAFRNADFVIECIVEDPHQKIAFFQMVADLLKDDAVMATNSSSMVPSMFAEYTGRPAKFMGMHFANNIWHQNIAECMKHAGTDQETFDAQIQFAGEIGMIPLKVMKEQSGFLLNSLLIPLCMKAMGEYVDEVADYHDIDIAWRVGTAAPMGPFRMLDDVGTVTAANIARLTPGADDPDSIPGKIVAELDRRTKEGLLGKAAGEGFYKYN